jgi:hypothetical protein
MREIFIVGAIGLATILVVLFVAAPILYAYERLFSRRTDRPADKSSLIYGPLELRTALQVSAPPLGSKMSNDQGHEWPWRPRTITLVVGIVLAVVLRRLFGLFSGLVASLLSVLSLVWSSI